MKKSQWLILALLLAAGWCYASRSDFRAFAAQREAWHRRCDVYVGQSSPQAQACSEELEAMVAYAKRKGLAHD